MQRHELDSFERAVENQESEILISIPSIGCISHSPKEFSRPQDIANGANVLLHALLNLDRANW